MYIFEVLALRYRPVPAMPSPQFLTIVDHVSHANTKIIYIFSVMYNFIVI